MLVVLFWSLLLIIVLSLITLIVFLILKKKRPSQIATGVLLFSIVALGFNIRACSQKVKEDFKITDKTEEDIQREKNNAIETQKVAKQLDSINQVIKELK